MIKLLDILNKKKKKRISFEDTQEFKFFIKNRKVLTKTPKFYFLSNNDSDEFSIMRANIIIRSYLNKVQIEKEISKINQNLNKKDKQYEKQFFLALKECIVDLPYLEIEKNNKIYIPFFSKPLNYIYIFEPYKMVEYPYSQLSTYFDESLIDPFDTYGAGIYNSLFSRLIKVSTNGKEVAYFHYDLNTIYIVNSQGRLDAKIVLFDKYLKKIHATHMIERIKPVIEAYFKSDRDLLIEELYKGEFMSEKMYLLLLLDKETKK